jgi:hypothetical protein
MVERVEGIRPKRQLDDVWVRAAVVGGLWASIEIIVGSFLHNVRVPLAGSMLAFIGTILLIGFYQLWPQKGLIIRAGFITAIMKSVSPSAIIIGPMTGIMLEAVLLELMIWLFGNNLFGLILAGIASVSSAIIHKLINILIFYGFDLIQIYVNIVNFALKQIGWREAEPLEILFVLLLFYAFFGTLAALLGLYIGKKSISLRKETEQIQISDPITRDQDFFIVQSQQKNFIPLLIFHILSIPAGLYMISRYEDYTGFIIIGLYVLLFGYYYRNSMRRMGKPVFWMQLLLIILLSAFFWDINGNDGSWVSMDGLFIGVEMVVRAIFVVTAFTAISVELHNQKVRSFLYQIGFGQFYQAVGMAFGALPIMISLLPKSREIIRHPLQSLLKPLVMSDQWLEMFRKG